MSYYNNRPPSRQTIGSPASPPALRHQATSPSPLRHASTASNGSSDYSNASKPSRTSTLSSSASYTLPRPTLATNGHKRGLSEIVTPVASSHDGYFATKRTAESNPTGTYRSVRESLRPLPQAPAASPPSMVKQTSPSHSRSKSYDPFLQPTTDGSGSPPPKSRPQSMALGRSDSIRGARDDRSSARTSPHAHFSQHLEKPALESFQKSSTSQLRTLSKFAKDASEEDLVITSPEQEVTGLHGRRRLQRGASVRGKPTTAGYGGRTWMDTQRQFLQAYEYLCHIGEAKEWIEDVIEMQIPPIVELEQALRDGVTLAEIVQKLKPEKRYRIFRNPRLQFRHSDNIAIFFDYLAEVELPDLFRFELVDLYEKKNIPKVIYCIHALSWLLFRKGIVGFRIGNLVGQLQFQDHELEAMQKGLDKSGVSMPNFSGMSAKFCEEPEPEPEPVESEEERIGRELFENEASITDLQAQIRGALHRLKLGDSMQELWDSEQWLVDLQSRIRGTWAREVSEYRLEMQRFATRLQSRTRGFLVRVHLNSEEVYWQDRQPQVMMVQRLVRARKARNNVQYLKSKLQRNSHGVRSFQAAIRGALERWRVGDQYHETRQTEGHVEMLQAAIRGALARKQVDDQLAGTKEAEAQVEVLQAAVRGMLERRVQQADRTSLRQQETFITTIQAAARAALMRKEITEVQEHLTNSEPKWCRLQALVRAQAVRKALQAQRSHLEAASETIIALQSRTRGRLERRKLDALKSALADRIVQVLKLQSSSRGHLLRRKHHADLEALGSHATSIVALQSAIRASTLRDQTYQVLCSLNEHEEAVVELQSLARAVLLRSEIGGLLSQLEDTEDSIVDLQAFARGFVIRSQFAAKQKHYKENMQKVVKLQSFVRGRQQGEAYKSLTSGTNPPVGTIKNFVHLLNDSDFDFDEEIEFERLRKTVVHQVRQNEMAEQYIDQLDIKIALLVKNKITLDEVVKHQRHFGGHVGSLLTNKDISSKDPFDLKALNKTSRKKLEHYQELFFMLQTQPQYLARLFKRIREQAPAEKESKRVELLIMGLFGFAQKRREEYYLLKLVGRSIKEEVDACDEVQDYLRSNFFWSKVFGNYIRSPRDRKFLKELLGPLIRENIMEAEGLDLESDPMQIYKSAINNEELRTGQRSRRNPDVPREVAIRDPETRETFIHHLQDLRDIADQFFNAMEDQLNRMPYGIRFVAQQMFQILHQRFPYEDEHHLLQIVGNWVWKTYLVPALTQPETWGVVDRGLSPLNKRNLGEVAKVVGQVAAGRLFGGEDIYLQPLNNYVTEAIGRLEDIWTGVINLRDAETQFDIDEFNDLYSKAKPTLYIKLTDIFALHQLVSSDLPALCPSQDDALREVIRELGSVKNNEHELMGVSSNEISLTLNPKLHEKDDPEAPIKALFMETKRLVLYIIRIQTGSNLLEIMVRPITADDEDRWEDLIRTELLPQNHSSSRTRGAYTDGASDAGSGAANALTDITAMTYTELKRSALEGILQLQQAGRISQANHYQDLLNAIALDIRTKHKRRIARAAELSSVRATLGALDDKAHWLESQLKSYNDYIEQAMITLQKSKGKKKFLLPFTRQYNHEKELERTGRKPKFGSYKYSARQLAEKGVLVDWRGYPEHRWNGLNITVSSDAVGVFHIEGSAGSMMIPGASASVPLDDLLQAQFNNCQFMNLFGGQAGGASSGAEGEGSLRLNVNLFLHLVFKKFYKDG